MKALGYWLPWLCLPLLALAESDTQREVRRVLALVPNPENGRELFARCSDCHRADGGGDIGRSIPRIAGQHYRVLVRQFVNFRRGDRWDARMEGFTRRHESISEPQAIADVLWYASRLETGSARGVGDGTHVELGAQRYARSCASCHGLDGEGKDVEEIPRLAGQHAGYLARQVHHAVDGGRPALARSHGKRFKPLSSDEILGLADYLARLGWNQEKPADQ